VYLGDVRDRRISSQRGVDPRRVRRFLLAMRQDDGLAIQIAQDSHDAFAVGAIVRHEHFAALWNERAERCFDGERAAAQHRIATRSRHTDAVSALKALSHDPQSESIADLVAAEVVRGPGVSSIGSVMGSTSVVLIGGNGLYYVVNILHSGRAAVLMPYQR
jgi:hypothetical protein